MFTSCQRQRTTNPVHMSVRLNVRACTCTYLVYSYVCPQVTWSSPGSQTRHFSLTNCLVMLTYFLDEQGHDDLASTLPASSFNYPNYVNTSFIFVLLQFTHTHTHTHTHIYLYIYIYIYTHSYLVLTCLFFVLIQIL